MQLSRDLLQLTACENVLAIHVHVQYLKFGVMDARESSLNTKRIPLWMHTSTQEFLISDQLDVDQNLL